MDGADTRSTGNSGPPADDPHHVAARLHARRERRRPRPGAAP